MSVSDSMSQPATASDAAWTRMERHSGRILVAGALVSVNIVLVELVSITVGASLVSTLLIVGLALALFLLLHRVVRRMIRVAMQSARREALVARQLVLAVEQIGIESAGVRGTIEALCASAQPAGLEVCTWEASERALWSPAWGERTVLTPDMARHLHAALLERRPVTVINGRATKLLPEAIACRGGGSALVMAPMWAGDDLVGIVLRRHASERELQRADDATLVSSFAALGSVAIGKALIVDREQQRARDNELLLRSMHAASETRQRDRLADHAHQATEALAAERGAVFALDGGRLALVGSAGIERIASAGAGSLRLRSRLVALAHHAGGMPFTSAIDELEEPTAVVLMRLGLRGDIVVQGLRDATGLVGLIVVEADRSILDEGTASMVSALGRQASMAIERTRMLRSIRKRSRHLACTPKLARSLTGQREPNAVARIAARELHEGFGFGRVTIALRDGAGTEGLHIVASSGALAASGTLPECTDAIRECFDTGRPYVSVAGDLEDAPASTASLAAGVASATGDPDACAGCRGRIVVPISGSDHRIVGAIAVYERDADSLGEDDLHMLETIADQLAGTLEQAELFATLERSYFETVEALSSALEAKDAYTIDHARSITDMSAEVGRRLGMREDEIRELKLGALLHDIGKIGVPTEILSKPGPLTDDEFEVMKGHTIMGEQIIAPIEFLQGVRPLVLHEHERWDGRGYPHQLRAEEIPLGARIIFVCDSWHAMTSDRPYRQALPNEEAIRRLHDGSGSQFDPQVVAVFCELMVAPVDIEATIEMEVTPVA